MKKYFILSMICLSSMAFAAKPDAPSLGEVNSMNSSSACDSQQYLDCGPCRAACLKAHSGEREAKGDVAGAPVKSNGKKSGSSQQ